MSTQQPITANEYNGLQAAFDYFNRELFAGSLPQTLITLQRHPRAKGYFAPQRFRGRRQAEAVTHEIALNPDTFQGRTDEEILSTLAHEMVHEWQQEQGTPPRRCYHDREWASKMKQIGLQPTDTGEPGGKETGQAVTHIIITGGRFQRAMKALKGVSLNWESPEYAGGEAAKARAAKKASKTKYQCPDCEMNAWAKPEANLICGDCEIPMEAQD